MPLELKSNNHDDDPLAGSTFRRTQRAMAHQIEKLEQESIAKKHWSLTGEVSSRQREQNSLLEKYVEFESNVKVIEYLCLILACSRSNTRSDRVD